VSDLPSGGVKGVKSARMDLIPFDALWQISLVYGFGATKYADRNWEAGYNWSQSFGALQRHLALFWSGEEVDEESGLPHLAHAGWHCLALLAFAARDLGTDDRTKDREALLKGLATMRAELTNPEIFEQIHSPSCNRRDAHSAPEQCAAD
jgi:dATP/dGTP diphosphohydrolase